MPKAKRHLITSALPYANGPLHIGHIAGAYLPADIYSRHLRSVGEEVLYICGSDEHGAAITLRAKKEGVSPKEIVDRYHQLLDRTFKDFGISFDIYHRTSSELHHETSSEYFKQLESQGVFEQQTTEQFFDPEAEQFLADRYISGTCPHCGSDKAYGDQCENCGRTLSPKELIKPRSTLSGSSPILKKTTHWFLPMGAHEDWIGEWLEKGELDGHALHDPKKWKKHVLGQCRSWVQGGLQARAMTRDLDWGVPVPLNGAEGKVLYVWLDAPIGYISATKKWAKENNSDWEKWWKDEESELIHFIGKDNIVFHCIIFPILLKLNKGFNLPKNVPANEFLNLESQKISTSRNHAVWLHEYLEDFPERIDELRYVLTSIMPESKDSEFTWRDFQARVNNELVAILGNFVNRAIVLTNKYFDGVVPEPAKGYSFPKEVEDCLTSSHQKVDESIRAFKFREALQHAMEVARVGNKYLADTEPWKLIKTDKEAVAGILFSALRLAHLSSEVLSPFLPNCAADIKSMLGHGDEDDFKPGTVLGKQKLLFKKVEDEEVLRQIEKLKQAGQEETPDKVSESQTKPMIEFSDFQKMDIRVAEIVSAEKVEGADKLLKLQVDLGSEKRQVVSGIAQHFNSQELVGKQVSLLVNLAPRKIRGVESQGMILLAEDEDGKLSFVSPEEKIINGSTIR